MTVRGTQHGLAEISSLVYKRPIAGLNGELGVLPTLAIVTLSARRAMNDLEDDDDDQSEDADSGLAEKLEYTRQLKDAIFRLHGCDSEYAGRDEVIEDLHDDDLYWSGYVEIFNLHGHAKAKRCYAWSQFTGEECGELRYVVVLELPPVDSPHAAVRAAIMAEMKSAEKEFKKGGTKET
jgi:hypothetical protein